MKAYCINLDRRPDRLAHMSAQFARAGIPFERIPAVDAQDPAVAAAAARLPASSAGAPMSAGAYGCFQSHREFWRRLMASGDSHAMIFEDDVLLAPDTARYLADDWWPAEAQIVRLETLATRAHLDREGACGAGPRELRRLRSSMLGTGCYALTATAAALLLERTAIVRDPVDQYLFNPAAPGHPSLAIYQMIPAPVIQGDRALRLRQGGVDPAWAASSIQERFAPGQTARRARPESLLGRLTRRLREEIRARRSGTRYVRVPHG